MPEDRGIMDQRANKTRSMSGQKNISDSARPRLVERLSSTIEVAGRPSHSPAPVGGVDFRPEAHALPKLGASERHKILYQWNDTRAEFPSDKCVHEMFEEQVAR